LLVADKLELPSSALLEVYVCYVNSASNIAVHIIDSNYSVRACNSFVVLLYVALLAACKCTVVGVLTLHANDTDELCI